MGGHFKLLVAGLGCLSFEPLLTVRACLHSQGNWIGLAWSRVLKKILSFKCFLDKTVPI